MSGLSGFTSLKDVESARGDCSFLGVIVDIKEPRVVDMDGVSSWMLEFTIQDQFTLPIQKQPRLKCTLQRTLSQLPKAKLGDVALLKNMQLDTDDQKMPVAINHSSMTNVKIFPEARIPAPVHSSPYMDGEAVLPFDGKMSSNPPTVDEQIAVINMKAAAKDFLPLIQKAAPSAPAPTISHSASKISLPPASVSSTAARPSSALNAAFRNKKFRLVKDMQQDKFCDIVAEVVKTYYVHDTVDLYVTDYTEHKDLFLYTDSNDPDNFGYASSRNWTGPFGQITIMIHLWEPHAGFARQHIQVGDIVALQNVRPRYSPENKLEGNLHKDRAWPDKICVHKCRDPGQLAQFQERKDAYYKQQDGQKKTSNDQNMPKKASAKAAAKKREEKRERRRTKRMIQMDEYEEEFEEKSRAGMNKHVRVGLSGIDRISTVAEIVNNPSRKTKSEEGLPVTLPFVNCKYKAHVRVVDMWPSDLANFSQSKGDAKFNPKATPEEREISKNKFEWNFALLVEDAKVPAKSPADRIMLTFGNTQGQFLLDMNASNLRRNPKKLKELEEKLFVLWGNLHERKMSLWEEDRTRLPLPSDDARLKLQNKPFECFIQEYGEPVGQWAEATDWIQRFSTFHTVIRNDPASV